jgi:SAM-dependent methyltransferase
MHFEDAMVDICISISCIEHLGGRRYGPDCRRSDRLLIEEILRILKPGGILIISVPYGIAQELPPHRVYDEMGIRELTEGLIERYREIYVPVDNESLFHYRIGSEEEAHMKRPWFRYSVIAIELQKPIKRLEL